MTADAAELGRAELRSVTTDADIERVYERRATHLWGYARRLGLDHERAEDVVQEAFARLLGLPSGRRPDATDAWLFRTVHNLAMDHHRRDKRTARPADPPPLPGPREDLDVWHEVDRLPERQRAAVYLRYRADLDFAAVASVLGISASGARVHVFRALARLRTRMPPEVG